MSPSSEASDHLTPVVGVVICQQTSTMSSPVERRWVRLKRSWSKHWEGRGGSPSLSCSVKLVGSELPPFLGSRSCTRVITPPSASSSSSTKKWSAKEYRLPSVCQPLRRLSRCQCWGRGIHGREISLAIAWLTTWVCQETWRPCCLITSSSPWSCGCGCHRNKPTSLLIPNNRCFSVLPDIRCC